MTEEEFSEQLGNEVTALVNSFVTSGRQTAGNPQFIAELNAINQKYNALKQQVQQQQQAQQQEQMQQMQQLQQVAKAGGDIAPLAKALPEEARAVANAEVE